MVGIGSMTEKQKGLTRRQEKALTALLSTPTVKQAAEQSGLGETTIYRFLSESRLFQQKYREARSAITRHAISHLQAMSGAAATVLTDMMKDIAAPPGLRLTAARLVLEAAVRAVEREDLEARVEALETALDQGKRV
jgi:hypothetical protein